MITEKMEKMLNDQLNKELYSSYLYLSMEAYYTSLNLAGFANWFHVQVQEERDHALIFFNYISKVGARVRLQTIDAPQVDFASIQEALELTLRHEQLVTKSIYDIVDLALEERDHKTNSFLQWFVTEQVEEEENATANIAKYMRVKDDGRGIMLLDAEMAARTYVQAAPLAAATA